jgi:hypothetical protein
MAAIGSIKGGVIFTVPNVTAIAYLEKYTDPQGRANYSGLKAFYRSSVSNPDEVLDQTEVQTITTFLTALNNEIKAQATAMGFAMLDAKVMFDDIKENGRPIRSSDGYSPGSARANWPLPNQPGLFGLDGVHPNMYGHAVMANELIKVINTKYNTTMKNMIDLKQQILEMECEPLDPISSNIADEYKPVSNELSILNVMKKAYIKQKEQADFSETIVANNDLINTITKTSFSSWYHASSCWYYAIKIEIDGNNLDATCSKDVLDTRYSNVYILTIKYPENFPKLTNKAIIKYNNNELKNINNEKYRESVQNIEILISKLILIKINRCNAVPRGRKPKMVE